MSALAQVDQYFAALERLRARGSTISNDAVSLEAGKGRGSIKRSRRSHAKLIEAIDAAIQQQTDAKASTTPMTQLQEQAAALKRLLDESLEREVALLREVYELRASVKRMEDDLSNR